MIAKFITADECIGYREISNDIKNYFFVPITFFEEFPATKPDVYPDIHLLVREYEYYRTEYDEFHKKRMPVYREARTR